MMSSRNRHALNLILTRPPPSLPPLARLLCLSLSLLGNAAPPSQPGSPLPRLLPRPSRSTPLSPPRPRTRTAPPATPDPSLRSSPPHLALALVCLPSPPIPPSPSDNERTLSPPPRTTTRITPTSLMEERRPTGRQPLATTCLPFWEGMEARRGTWRASGRTGPLGPRCTAGTGGRQEPARGSMRSSDRASSSSRARE